MEGEFPGGSPGPSRECSVSVAGVCEGVQFRVSHNGKSVKKIT